MNESVFPTYCDYYYCCRIFNVEEAKREYSKCNGFLLGSGSEDSPAMKLLADKTEEEKEKIYIAYKKLCDDFNSTAQMLIDKEGIESKEDYIRGMGLLMIIANQTIMFTCKEFYMQKNALLRKKHFYFGKMIRLSAIIDKNNIIPYILNPDDIATVFADRYGNAILWTIGISLILVGFKLLYDSVYISELQTICSIIEAAWYDLFIALGLFICYSLLSARKMVSYYEKRSKTHSRNQYLVVYPYKNKFTLKNIKEVLEILKYFKN